MNPRIPILDNGHGGLINGKYQTAGKRSPRYKLYEGEFNRAVVNRIKENLNFLSIPYYHVSPEDRDVSLQTRVNRANKIYSMDRSSYLISIHSNAGGGRGVEVFTSPGETKSDSIATEFIRQVMTATPNTFIRDDWSDGDVDKERKFYILVNTKCPAILTENYFMDNDKECFEILMTRKGRDMVARYHTKMIENLWLS